MGADSRSPGLSPVQAEATWCVTGAGVEGPGDGLQPSRFIRPLVARMRVINPSIPLSHEVSDKKAFYLIIRTETWVIRMINSIWFFCLQIKVLLAACRIVVQSLGIIFLGH